MKSKFKASGIHLLLSATIVSFFMLLVIMVWYPQPFLDISGLRDIMIILVTVDIVLGPILTFLIFKPGKRTLKLDLSVIAGIQIAALAYGMFTIYQGHPVYVTYSVDHFKLITANEVNPNNARYEELRVSTLGKPTLVYAQRPSDPKEKERLIFEVLEGKPDIDARPEYYEPFDQFAEEVLQQGLTPQQVTSSPENQQKLSAFLEKHGKNAADYAYLPLIGKEKDVLWVWDRTNAKPVGTLDINPWQLPKVAANR